MNPERSFICPSLGLNVELGASISGYADKRSVIDTPPLVGARMKRRDFLRSAAGAALGVVGTSAPTLVSETSRRAPNQAFHKSKSDRARVRVCGQPQVCGYPSGVARTRQEINPGWIGAGTERFPKLRPGTNPGVCEIFRFSPKQRRGGADPRCGFPPASPPLPTAWPST